MIKNTCNYCNKTFKESEDYEQIADYYIVICNDCVEEMPD